MKNKKQKKLIFILINIVIIIATVLLIKFAFTKFYDVAKGYTSGNKENVEISLDNLSDVKTIKVVIPEGAGTAKIAEILKENNLITSELMFRLKSKNEGFDGTYKFGTYEIPVTANQDQIMVILKKGGINENLVKVTIPEGYTINKIASILEERGITSSESFKLAANKNDYDFDFVKDIPDRENRLEGYLFPDTYFFEKDSSAEDIVNAMLSRFSTFYTEDVRNKVSQSGRTLDDIMIVASMVESEIRIPEERPIAAGVIYNRLEIDMPLQIDSTVQYALGTRNEQVTLNDLEVDSPYNTYKNKGLPLGPISNPGSDAIMAAITPDDNNYLYYVVEAGGNGSHVYTETYEEFLKAKQAYKNDR